MSITFLSNPIHLPDFFKFDREYLGKQESQNEDQKVFHKDTLEVSQLSKNRENLMDKIKHTVVHSVTSFSDMRAGILKEIREEKGQYDYTDVVNACGLSYARLYSEIEERYKNGNSSIISQQVVHHGRKKKLSGWICNMSRKWHGRNPVPE